VFLVLILMHHLYTCICCQLFNGLISFAVKNRHFTIQEERDAVSSKIEVSQVHLDLLKCINILNDVFHISHDGEIGTISNFHLGHLPNVKVSMQTAKSVIPNWLLDLYYSRCS
jgi:hypothetical protein